MRRDRSSSAFRSPARKSRRSASTTISFSTTSCPAPSIAFVGSYLPNVAVCRTCSGPRKRSPARFYEHEPEKDSMIDRSKLANSFEFVVTAGARARQLLVGSTPRGETSDDKKKTIAQREVLGETVKKIAADATGS